MVRPARVAAFGIIVAFLGVLAAAEARGGTAIVLAWPQRTSAAIGLVFAGIGLAAACGGLAVECARAARRHANARRTG